MALNQESEVLSTRELEQISRLAFKTCGIDLRAGKRELVQARIGKKMRQGRFGSIKDYLQHVEADRTGQELIALLDCLTTNFTSFLREPAHFEFLRNTILPGLRGEIRIWSAACSTGEEPFTIAFSLLEALGNAEARRIRILASDISTRVLETAKGATYPADRFTGCPPQWLKEYLLRGTGQSAGLYRVKPAVRSLIEFRRWNLMETLNPPQPFHVIFCRNVMIYFDKETQEGVVNRLAACLAPGGYLLVGHAESLTGLRHPFTYVKPAVYRKPL
jgi:chemotaxis protein methyltransferase CheR